MAFTYDKQSRSAFDAETRTTVRINPKFQDIYPQPFEVLSAEGKIDINYEMEHEPILITPKNGEPYMHRIVVAIRLQERNVKHEFVRRMRGHLKAQWPPLIPLRDAHELYQAGFEELTRNGQVEGYEGLKSYIIEGVRTCWTEGNVSSRLEVTFFSNY